MGRLITDVIRTFMEKNGPVETEKVTSLLSMAERKEYGGMFEAALESIREVQEEVRAEGRAEGLETAARNALAEGASLEFVSKITGFDIDTIKALG